MFTYFIKALSLINAKLSTRGEAKVSPVSTKTCEYILSTHWKRVHLISKDVLLKKSLLLALFPLNVSLKFPMAPFTVHCILKNYTGNVKITQWSLCNGVTSPAPPTPPGL